MSSKMVKQKHHSCTSKDSESSLSNDCETENHSASNNDENHSQIDVEEGRYVTDKTSNRPSLFLCWICQKNFSSMAALKVHCLSHSAPYVCGTCHMEFPQMKNLRIHGAAAHTEKRLLVCEECGKVCPTTSQLRIHLAVHSVEKPYKCAFCKRGFTQMHSLKRHCEQHTILPVDARGMHSKTFSLRRGRREGFTKNAEKPCFWDNLRKGFSKNYLKDRRQAMEKKLKFIKFEVD